MALTMLGLAWLSWPESSSPYFPGPEQQCGVCRTLADLGGSNCASMRACHLLNDTRNGCAGACQHMVETEKKSTPLSPVQLRVAKGFGTKEYGTLRISVISPAGSPPSTGASDYCGTFRYKWTHNQLCSSIVNVTTPGATMNYTVAGTTTQISLPAQGAGVAGVLIADPCVGHSIVPCTYGKSFKTTTRTPALLNAFVGRDSDYWAILGDNFYDRDGDVTATVYNELSLETLSRVHISVPGNHDYWVLSNPLVASKFDQFGNGHFQWYAQDTRAAATLGPGDASPPFNYSIDPGKGHLLFGGNLPAIDNSFFYNQIGNVGYASLPCDLVFVAAAGL